MKLVLFISRVPNVHLHVVNKCNEKYFALNLGGSCIEKKILSSFSLFAITKVKIFITIVFEIGLFLPKRDNTCVCPPCRVGVE